jgi:hypothetical protein
LIICNNELRNFDYLLGWPASVHDSHVWNISNQFKKGHFFPANQYLLADSSFGITHHCIPAFKRVHRGPKLPKDKEELNKLLSKARVKVEHCIGLLKNRFQSLQNIRVVVY